MHEAAAPALPQRAWVSASWCAQARWTVLDTGFGTGHTFLDLWHTWRTHPLRPTLLHYVGVLSAAQAQQLPAQLQALGAHNLAAHCYALDAGFHRLLLEDDQLSLTLCVGDTATMLAQQDMQADCLLVASPEPYALAHPHASASAHAHSQPLDSAPWDKWQIKALARCCCRGAALHFAGPLLPAPGLLQDAGFVLTQAATPTPTSTPTSTAIPTAFPAAIPTAIPTATPTASSAAADGLHAVYQPHWLQHSERSERPLSPGSTRASRHASPVPPASRCAVIGAGIAGASVARALALRGLAVDVYDTHALPAGGASGLPVGLVVPHHSADDSPRSRLSRHGTRLMLQHASALLCSGEDWQASGVLELQRAAAGLAADEAETRSQPLPTATDWARPMAYGDAQGLWHAHAAWIKPAPLVRQWLAHARIAFHGQAEVHTLQRLGSEWLLCDAQGQELGRAERVVVANAYGCVRLLQGLAQSLAHSPTAQGPHYFAWVPDALGKLQAMQLVHGTLSHGPVPQDADARAALPAFPVNGHGSLVSGVPSAQGPRWYAGATFQADVAQHAQRAKEHAANWHKLQTLLPAAAQALAPQFAGTVQAWQGSRCISHDRLPLVGPLDGPRDATLWLCAGMGARGLSFSALCAELLAATLCGEPLPVELRLARALSTLRPRRAARP